MLVDSAWFLLLSLFSFTLIEPENLFLAFILAFLLWISLLSSMMSWTVEIKIVSQNIHFRPIKLCLMAFVLWLTLRFHFTHFRKGLFLLTIYWFKLLWSFITMLSFSTIHVILISLGKLLMGNRLTASTHFIIPIVIKTVNLADLLYKWGRVFMVILHIYHI